jgi:hypothetical protein
MEATTSTDQIREAVGIWMLINTPTAPIAGERTLRSRFRLLLLQSRHHHREQALLRFVCLRTGPKCSQASHHLSSPWPCSHLPKRLASAQNNRYKFQNPVSNTIYGCSYELTQTRKKRPVEPMSADEPRLRGGGEEGEASLPPTTHVPSWCTHLASNPHTLL